MCSPTYLVAVVSFYTDPNSDIQDSYFSRSAAETDFETFLSASSKSSMVTGICSSSLERARISSGLRPWILLRIAIIDASLRAQKYKVHQSNQHHQFTYLEHAASFKGIVHPQMKICWKCTHPQSIQHIDEFVSSSEQILRNLALHHFLTNGSSAVNGCHQNPNSS